MTMKWKIRCAGFDAHDGEFKRRLRAESRAGLRSAILRRHVAILDVEFAFGRDLLPPLDLVEIEFLHPSLLDSERSTTCPVAIERSSASQISTALKPSDAVTMV